MGNQLTRFDRKKYTFYSEKFGTLEIDEPEGWNDDEKELIRSDKFYGIMTSLSNNLSFYGKAFNYLKSAYDIDGIKANIRMECEERDDNTDEWVLVYDGHFDFSTYKQDRNYIRIKFNESQFFKNIESRWKDKFELERLDDLKGGVLAPLEYDILRLRGRDIFRESKFYAEESKFSLNTGADGGSYVIPMEIVYRSDENVVETSLILDSSGYAEPLLYQITDPLNSSAFFYITSEVNNTFNLKLSGSVNINMSRFTITPPGTQRVSLRVAIAKYKALSDTEFEFIESYEVIPFNTLDSTNETFIFDFDEDIEKEVGDCFSLFFTIGSSFVNPSIITFSNVDFLISEDSIGTTTNVETLTVYKAVERLLMIITGKNTFSSDLLTGFWKDLVLTNGFKVRNIPDKNITTSLEEIFDGLMAIDDVAFIIKNNTSRIELKSEVYRNEIIDLGEVSNINREIVEKLHFSSIEIGTDFNGVYEEVNGPDEFNIRSTYTTCIDNVDNPHKAISKVRYDAYGITLAQLKPYVNYPKEDTKYDKENFFIDTIIKEIPISSFPLTFALRRVVRNWEDDFDDEPTGIFSPDTAFNLRLSPFNSLLRKSKYLSTGLQKYPTELLKYSSTEGNSQLVTLYPERAVVQNNILRTPYFLPEQIEFERKTTMLEFRNIVLNPYSLFKFVNEYGKEEYCYIFGSIKPNKEGKFLMIKANI